jgi:hypothetical protein
MNVDTIRQAVRRHPFVPFTVRMNDKRVFFVPHPEYIAVSRREIYIVDPATDAGTFLEPVLIASLEYQSPDSVPSPSSDSNGPN